MQATACIYPLRRAACIHDVMNIDPANPVVALCAAGMAVAGDAVAATDLFEQAWAARKDDYDACIAAHFLARHQATTEARVHWNVLAAAHAEAVTDGSADEFKASLYLNLADAQLLAGDHLLAREALAKALACVDALPDNGYRTFVERGIAGVQQRLATLSGRRESGASQTGHEADKG